MKQFDGDGDEEGEEDGEEEAETWGGANATPGEFAT
jgi:hypothetical protein